MSQVLNMCCLKGMRAFPDNSFDSIVTDPPYELGFMGKAWDSRGIAYSVELWSEALRVLKPGGHLLAFSGSRTYHRMTCAIEDAGFEVRDQIMWVYGSGFPKSHNLAGEWDGWGTALKPAHEPICVARKPLIGTVAANVLAHGTGALNIDGCRVATDDNLNGGTYSPGGKAAPMPGDERTGAALGMFAPGARPAAGFVQPDGRWPANLIHDGSDEVTTLFGEPARFFYCAKTSKTDRGAENIHPTVKPTDLMAYLCRLVTPPGGVVLDPFAGSGSTGKAAVREGFQFVGFELSVEYAAIANARIEHMIHLMKANNV